MAACVIVIEDEERWRTILDFLQECGEGAVVIGPQAAAAFQAGHGRRLPDGELMIDYDFGGQADLMIDYTDNPDLTHYAFEAILDLAEEESC